MPTTTPPPPTDFEGRRSYGSAARVRAPRSSHGIWGAPEDRADPVSLLEDQAASRVADLVPVRHGRMSVSPFTFYRGAALLMAADLARTPSSGLIVQLCGDAHLSNFGLFASAERRLVFDINDFDETHPGPFEWDLKRLVASFEIAGRHRGFADDERRAILLAAARGYRERMLAAAEATVLDAWYDHLDVEALQRWLREEQSAERAEKRQLKRFDAVAAKALGKDRMQAFAKLVTTEDGRMRITADPPLIVPVEDLLEGTDIDDPEAAAREILRSYQGTLPPAARHPLSEYTYVHMARKVVGVGSVGTRAWIVLLRGRDESDPLFLQAKEAQASVLERFLEPCEYENQGERVVRGQRTMQASGDMFLGWQTVRGEGGIERDFYVRQLHDWKGAMDAEKAVPRGTLLYARICGETLARAHAPAMWPNPSKPSR
ncbi:MULTISPECIES: DUF2252 domain-containing protein [unclassified Microbacterium]|uniref:DUF2252 domain-containing protein n=1 Tax=unclassified Microbacterium TaxID=2609290 RepID=UPI00214B9FFE|nr:MULTISPECIES: DUF2252 domain-containing protein [unclassified Microbacterium]MCR2808680.1 DUF2252 domain-containing protein [Microbacterium sp. zg.B185]WIM18888.1 DUF2252 domain-containing protein [Microbacterium sp. zg-B185]